MIPLDLVGLQIDVMLYVKWWANCQKTPIPQKNIIKNMELQGIKYSSLINALNALLEKGFIRRAYSEKQNRTYYVMIRNI
jgi:hypothetical protein